MAKKQASEEAAHAHAPAHAQDTATKLYRVCGPKSVILSQEKDPVTGRREVVARYGDVVEMSEARAAKLGADVVVPQDQWDELIKKKEQARRRAVHGAAAASLDSAA